MQSSKENILKILEQVKDPEIPVLSLVDLGVITNVLVTPDSVSVELTPTFVGCPAIEMMKEEIINVLKGDGFRNVSVFVSYKEPWNSDKISEKGKAALKKFGLAPPPPRSVIADLDFLENAVCPRCNGTNTKIETPFGSTLCRSIHYCLSCKEAFEQFKPL